MKYKNGSIVLLNDGRTVYVFHVDKENREYHVSDTDNENETFTVKESDIFELVVTA